MIIKWCHAEVNKTYPTCAFIKFISGVTFSQLFATNLRVNGKLKYTHTSMKYACVYISVPIYPKIRHKWLEKCYSKDEFSKSTRRI